MALPSTPLSSVEQLIAVMSMEAESVEAIHKTLVEQQYAIINFSGEELEYATERCNELTRSIRAFEKDRVRLLEKSLKGTPAEKYASSPNAFEHLLGVLDNRGGIKSKLKSARDRLQNNVANVMHINSVNSLVLEHSMNYASQNIRLITSNFSRQLVDQKI